MCEDNVQPFYSCTFNVGNPQKPQKGRYEDADNRMELWKINKERSKNFPDETKKITNKIYTIFREVKKNNYNHQANILKKEIPNLALLESFEEKIGSIEKEQAKDKKSKLLNSLQKDLLKSAESLPSKFKAWQKFERELRQIKNQDILTWMMCVELWEREEAKDVETPKLYLKDLDTDATSEERLNALNVVKPMKLKVNVYQTNQQGMVKKGQTPIGYVYIREENTKLLKQSNFKALAKDRRLNGLLSFVNGEGVEEEMRFVSKIRVEHELAKYQHARIELFQWMHHLESKLFEKGYRSPDNKFRTLLNNWLEKQDNKDGLQCHVSCLITIRNAIAHNQYPMYDGNIFKETELFCLKTTPQTPEKEGMGITAHLVSKTKEAIKAIEDTDKITS
ncbi:MAG: type VI-B CRISPR-associated RNA-guided ribonuclease Cas13b [Prevotella sp.]|nr:type VI-B CRISPR-associated RNA-guided ribonuclease Cas13b [Prevotella sp.]